VSNLQFEFLVEAASRRFGGVNNGVQWLSAGNVPPASPSSQADPNADLEKRETFKSIVFYLLPLAK
jgi:hypothetical protein